MHLQSPDRRLGYAATSYMYSPTPGVRIRKTPSGSIMATALSSAFSGRNIVLIINDMLIPLRPIPFYSQLYCRDRKLEYRTEHDLVIDYLRQLDLVDYIGSYDPRDVVVLTDSGYDNKKIETAIANKGWNFIIALGVQPAV